MKNLHSLKDNINKSKIQNDKEYMVIYYICERLKLKDIKSIYKMNRINDSMKQNKQLLQEYLTIVMDVYNNLSKEYQVLKDVCKCVYGNIKHILLNHSIIQDL